MKSRTSELAVGIFVIIFGIALFFLAMKVSGLVGTNLRDSYSMTAQFDNVNGLKPRAKVTMSGVTIGRVESITLDPVSRLATVKFDLDGKLTSFNAEQIKELSKLERGVAAIFQNDWVEPVLVKVNKCQIDEKFYLFNRFGI